MAIAVIMSESRETMVIREAGGFAGRPPPLID